MNALSEALAPRSDQLNADELMTGPRVLKITAARILSDGRQKRITLNYENDQGKPFKPCKTMGRAMVMVWGITDEDYEAQLIGKSIRVYRDPEVTFGAEGQVGGIRISHMSHIAKPVSVKLTVSQGKKSIFTFHPLVTDVTKSDGPSPAEKWATDHIAFVTGSVDLERLATIQQGGAKAMAKLLTSDPALHQRVLDAYAKRLDELAIDGDEPEEGRADDDMGDAFDGTDPGADA